jgi:hypothetical protein
MEIIFLVATALLLMFSALAIFDGFYLHLVKYRLYKHPESKLEHLMHLVRAVLFPCILTFLYLRTDITSFWIGTAFVALDILALGIDAYTEGDSRVFMGGLPRWEYILHLFVNGFHFAGVAVYFVAKLRILPESVQIITNFDGIYWYSIFTFVVQQMLPGAVLMALLHIIVANRVTVRYWDVLLAKFASFSVSKNRA